MNTTRAQRDILESISLKLWGTSSRWRKLADHPSFRVPVEQVQVERPRYVQKNKTIMKLETAMGQGYIPHDNSVTVVQNQVITRSPTPDEMIYMLERHLEERRLYLANTTVTEEEMAILVADRFFEDERLDYPWTSVVIYLDEKDRAEFDKRAAESPRLFSFLQARIQPARDTKKVSVNALILLDIMQQGAKDLTSLRESADKIVCDLDESLHTRR